MKKLLILTLISFSFLSVAEIKNNYLDLWEEEKMARDVYTMLSRKYDSNIFYNIKSSEDRHMSQVESLLKLNNVPIPNYRNQFGVFQMAKYQNLYALLVNKGNLSFRDAVEVGIIIEESDINDLDELIKNSESDQEDYVLHSLRSGSVNHLNAFKRQ
jgi:hypothetical protein